MLSGSRIIRHSIQTLGSNFPYKFGGVTQSSNKVDTLGEMMISTLYQNDLKNGFQMAYRGILDALAEKDVEYLKQNLEAKLTNRIEFPQCKVANPDSSISQNFTFLKLVMGASFNRGRALTKINTENSQITKLTGVALSKMVNIEVYRPNQLVKNSHLILQIGVDFTSPLKLIRPEDDPSSQETHSFQFQSVTEFNLQEELREFSPSNIMKIYKKLSQILLTPDYKLKNYVWKISDIDHSLKGNPWSQ